MELYSLSDCAAELIITYRHQLEKIVNPDKLLDLLAAGIIGGSVGYKPYVKAYLDSQGQVDAPDTAASAGNKVTELRAKLGLLWKRLISFV